MMKHHRKSTRYVAEQIVAVVEKVLGTGFDPTTDDVLLSELTTLLQEELPNGMTTPVPAPDAHLEMAFEDRISGNID
jgi:hypothetical protein